MTGTVAHRLPPKHALVRLCVAMALAVTAACAGSLGGGAEREAQPQPAQAWFAAYDSALHQGIFTLRSFYTEDTHVDLSSLGVPAVTGRDPALQAIGSTFVPSPAAPSAEQRIYLSPPGAVEAAPIEETASDAHRLVAIDEMGADGLARQVFAVSELAWREGFPDDPRILAVHELAQGYAQAWAAGSTQAVTRLYAAGALLADGLDGVRASSRESIAALATRGPTQGGLPGATIDQLPGLSGPAVFAVLEPRPALPGPRTIGDAAADRARVGRLPRTRGGQSRARRPGEHHARDQVPPHGHPGGVRAHPRGCHVGGWRSG